ncbi:MAG TPA: SDR family NAD(P)-dependent oxidoreductase [Myxococcales bacterium]|nr:SDR family NAD(P)-dependent oxidoreductase [Myxococcales bacterium]
MTAMTKESGRSVIVTGGTGALGRRVVEAFLREGARVTVPWFVEAEAEAMPSHDAMVLVEADLTEPDGAAAVVETAGSVDVLVNGVGGFAAGGPVSDGDIEIWDRLYRMNVRTAVCMTGAAAKALSAHGGAVINVASQAALDCPAGIAAYSASKAAIVALTRSLHAEMAASGVRVNAVVPTTIDTPANRAAMPDADFSDWTLPEEIARVMVWLASDSARTVAGGLIPV